MLRFVKGQFHEYQESTIGAAFLTQTVSVDENTVVKFEIWDTAGQERYHSLAPMYYRGAQAAIVVYDITNQVRALPPPLPGLLFTCFAWSCCSARDLFCRSPSPRPKTGSKSCSVRPTRTL